MCLLLFPAFAVRVLSFPKFGMCLLLFPMFCVFATFPTFAVCLILFPTFAVCLLLFPVFAVCLLPFPTISCVCAPEGAPHLRGDAPESNVATESARTLSDRPTERVKIIFCATPYGIYTQQAYKPIHYVFVYLTLLTA